MKRTIQAEIERAVSSWRDHGRALGMTDGELEAFADAFEHPERDAVRRASAR
jgi:serine/threonine-protein kinase HipA